MGTLGSLAWVQSLQDEAARLVARGIDLVYPPCCPICRREPESLSPADRGPPGAAGISNEWAAAPCGPCSRELAADVHRCLRCGAPDGGVDDRFADGCRLCRRRRPAWRQVMVLSSYAGGLRESVLRAKRPAGEGIAAALATLLVGKHHATLEAAGIDLVVPVPMHWLRRSLRGTSAAEELARRVAATLGRPWGRALARRRATRMQNELPIELRPDNVRDAFRARRRLDGAAVLLVDDVLTTGATLGACCRALTAAGAATIDVAVVARADSERHHDA